MEEVSGQTARETAAAHSIDCTNPTDILHCATGKRMIRFQPHQMKMLIDSVFSLIVICCLTGSLI